MQKLKSQNIELQFDKAKFEIVGSYSMKFVETIEADKALILDVIGELGDNQIVVAVSPSGIFLIRAESQILTELMSFLKNENIRGGIGNNKLIGMGRVDLEPNDFLKLLHRSLI